MNYWLFKTEPEAFSINDLALRPNKREGWDGVRNYQARNFMRDDMRVDDLAFIYHSSCKTVGIAGLAKIVKTGLSDPSQFKPESTYYDVKSTPENPRWFMVELEHVDTFAHVLPLSVIKQHPEIVDIALVKKGRLSVMPILKKEFELLLLMCKERRAV